MRFLGIDFGEKRIGIAISDERGVLAFPKEIISNDSKSFNKLGKIIKTENIAKIVIGESKDLKGRPNPILIDINKFIVKIENEFGVKVFRQEEFFTSVEARGREGKEKNNARKVKKLKSKKIDALAAALILQRYLDKINK